LCKKDSEYKWGPEHCKAFTSVKSEILNATYLQFYDSTKPLTLQVDASTRGLGAALLQEKGPVAFASKALSETEYRYSNIEREMLGIVFGLERFHHYVFGRNVLVETDHKPLESIVQKNLHVAPPRLARMLLCVQRYHITVKYVPGKQMPLADALSRITPCPASATEGLDISIHELYSNLNASTTRITQVREETIWKIAPLLCFVRRSLLDGLIAEQTGHKSFMDIGITVMNWELKTALSLRDHGLSYQITYEKMYSCTPGSRRMSFEGQFVSVLGRHEPRH